MFRYKFRTLLVVLTLGPPLLALEWWYFKESSVALLVLLVVGLSLILWLLNVVLWGVAHVYEVLCQLIGAKRRGGSADDSNWLARR